MHKEAFEAIKDFTQEYQTRSFNRALDVGGQDVNSTSQGIHPHTLFDVEHWDILDIYPGKSVTIVADGTTWRRPEGWEPYDLVLSTETLEHVANWQGILETCIEALAPGGVLVATWAAPPRPPHSAEGHPDPFVLGEHYANVSTEQVDDFLRDNMEMKAWDLRWDQIHGDGYLYSVKED